MERCTLRDSLGFVVESDIDHINGDRGGGESGGVGVVVANKKR